MTYCCGILVREGLVMIADTRTNAGLDNISTFRKLHLFREPGERVMAIATSGNLAISQSVISTLNEGMENPETGEVETLMNAPSMFVAAQRIGQAIRKVKHNEGLVLQAANVDFSVSFLLGGQIKGRGLRLFMIYPEGNFIEASDDTPFFQIGETKYGRPILVRGFQSDMSFESAVKLLMVSFDSTMAANLSVALPLDMLLLPRDKFEPLQKRRFAEDDPYFNTVSTGWSDALRSAFHSLPDYMIE